MSTTHLDVPQTSPKERLPLPSLIALFTAGLITTLTEALPAGVLPQMSQALEVSESVAGQTVTIYAAGTLLTAIPVALATATWPRRHLLLAALVGFVIANLVTALSLNISVTMVARFVAGAASGVVWSLLGGYAARLVGPALKGRAMAFAFAGTPVALSLGVPVGAYLGKAVGWQLTFGLASALTALLIIWTARKLPNFAGQKAEDRIPLRNILKLRGIRTVLVVTGAFVLAHAILYTYIAPILTDAGLPDHVQWILLDFGIASIVSIWLTGVFIDRHHRRLVLVGTGLFAAAAAVLTVASSSAVVDYVTVAAWGLAFGGAPTLLQSALMRAAGEHADVAQPSMVTTWNLGIGLGGLVGGAVLAGFGSHSLLIAAVVLLVPTVLVVILARRHAFPTRRPGSD
ncbi:MFS transporter [Micromonospora parathelypteridis]|uniref:Putative MFS family arabinose efflux permease n=1 Tax=Micromonospora parathelypteridis TaxID=1839617 RepID=A0A840W1Q3_9ACTN|nr:MFS transporter [Micromonospora parathelypteridis]MBB5480004.1 putative MFS family arabinose efflux permease [Micromonospora parathelypteridis]GGO25474.1 MFS transporter [Micromonospora parathelypteridis]